jgi:membrane associated rhomboid family serine protease
VIPVGDLLRTRSTPYVNWTLIAINVAVFVYMLTLSTRPDLILGGFATSESDRFLLDWGFVAACLGDYVGIATDASPRQMAFICPPGDRELLQPFTSMFIHAGWAHLIGNMLFLLIFGDNVEDRLGHVRYLIFYLLVGLGAVAAQTYMALDTVVPSVGASGAIAGIMGAYLMMYPKAIVQVVILPFFFVPFSLPAVFLIGFWFAMQLFAGLAEVAANTTAGSGVAWWAHIGGFVAGAALIWVFKPPQRRLSMIERYRDT